MIDPHSVLRIPHSGVLVFAMPFAAPAALKHTAKLLDCLTPICSRLALVGDGRIDLSERPAHVVRQAGLPTLHYLANVQPGWWSVLLWLGKLAWVLAGSVGAVLATRRETEVVVCFQGTYYTPILVCARLLGKRTVIFEPGNDVANAEIAYG